jgi:hypothetical protein
MLNDPTLVALRGELERRGMVVAPHGDHLCVRLPLFTSVRFRRDGETLRAVPQLGPLTRGPGIAAALTPLAATGVGVLVAGVTAPLAAAACLATVLALAGVCGVVLAEGCVTRVTLLWELRASPVLASPAGVRAPSAIAAPEAHRLGEPS